MLEGEQKVLSEGEDAPSVAIVPQVKNTLMSASTTDATDAIDATDVDPTKGLSSTKLNLALWKTTLTDPSSALTASNPVLGGVSTSAFPAITQTNMDAMASIEGFEIDSLKNSCQKPCSLLNSVLPAFKEFCLYIYYHFLHICY